MVADAKALDSNRGSKTFTHPRDDFEKRRFVGSFSGHERNAFFMNEGATSGYRPLSYGAGLDFDEDGRAVAPLDMDGDGDLDLITLSLDGPRLLMNTTQRGHWLRLELIPQSGAPLGTTVWVTTAAGQQVKKVQLTSGFHTQVHSDLHFGLGRAQRASIRIRWPSGRVDTHSNLAGHISVREGGDAQGKTPKTWVNFEQSRTTDFRTLTAKDLRGNPQSILATDDRATVVNLWAPWCKACEKEMPNLARFARREADKIRVVALSVEAQKLGEVSAFLQGHKIDLPALIATQKLSQVLTGQTAVSLPTTVVFDARGHRLRIFRHAVHPSAIRDVLAQSRVTAEDHRASAVAALKSEGLDTALEALKASVRADPRNATARWRLGTILLRLNRNKEARLAFKKSIKYGQEDPETWVDLAETYRRLNQPEGQRIALERAISFKHSVRAYVAHGRFLLSMKQWSKAIKSLSQATKIAPQLGAAWRGLAQAQRALGQNDAASESARRANDLIK